MAEYAKSKPAGFKNAIEKVAIVGVCAHERSVVIKNDC